MQPGQDRSAAAARRRQFAQMLSGNGDPLPLVTIRQVHSDVVHAVTDLPAEELAGDGLITNTPGLLLGIKTADCVPVLVADRNVRAVGAFHAGWRGTLARIVEKGVGELRKEYGSKPEDMVAAIGPGIHRCCYEVEDEFRDKFAAQ